MEFCCNKNYLLFYITVYLNLFFRFQNSYSTRLVLFPKRAKPTSKNCLPRCLGLVLTSFYLYSHYVFGISVRQTTFVSWGFSSSKIRCNQVNWSATAESMPTFEALKSVSFFMLFDLIWWGFVVYCSFWCFFVDLNLVVLM